MPVHAREHSEGWQIQNGGGKNDCSGDMDRQSGIVGVVEQEGRGNES